MPIEEFDPKRHWENVYQSKKPGEVSWYQEDPAVSRDLIALTGVNREQKIIDVGGGASVLADALLEKEFCDITVLDISAQAIGHAQERMKGRAQNIVWIEADITTFEPTRQYDLWHDRAVFHFLTNPLDRKKYIEVMKKAVKPNGHIIIAAFSPEGPSKCSGLNIERYNPEKLSGELGKSLHLIKSVNETHVTPWQTEQKFVYCYFKYVP